MKTFIRGLRREFISVEESLKHVDAERKLVPLHSPDTLYDADNMTVTYDREFNGIVRPFTVIINPAFQDYMEKWGENTRYVTDNGTPWLVRSQKLGDINPEQAKDYYAALSNGPNEDIVMISWRNTDLLKHKDSGHSALSVGTLHKVKEDAVGGEEGKPHYHYEPEITGSFYPSTGPLFRPAKLALQPVKEKLPPRMQNWMRRYSNNTGHYMTAARERHGEHPSIHSAGVVVRDSVLPVSAALGSMIGVSLASKMYDLIRDQQDKPDSKAMDKAIKAMAVMAVGYAAAKTTGALDAATGVVLLKEEQEASGILATLVTPGQMDIMQHTLYGMYKTYYDKYNILGRDTNHNCADFSDKMMKEIGLDMAHILGLAIQEDKAVTNNPFSRVAKSLSVPEAIRPSRISYAFRNRKPITGEVEIDGQPLSVSLVKVNGQSAALIESTEFMFGDNPISTFQKVMKEALTLQTNRHGQNDFMLQPHIKQIEPTRVVEAASR